MADIVYYVNEPLGTVVAKMPTFVKDTYREYGAFIRKHLPLGFSVDYRLYTQHILEILIKTKYNEAIKNLYGKATCNYVGGEIFDEEKGKELAKQRLMVKVFKLRSKLARDVKNHMMENLSWPFGDKMIECNELVKQYEENVKKLEAEC